MNRVIRQYHRLLRRLVTLLAAVSGAGLLGMTAVTCLDIVCRNLGRPIPGAVDLVQILACISISTALPYTTAVKGHIAVELLFRKLPRRLQIVLDTATRAVVLATFSLLAWRCFVYGNRMLRRHTLALTLDIPLFWVLWLMGLSFVVVILVKLYNLAHPGREFIRP